MTDRELLEKATEPKLYRLERKDGAAWFPASEWMTEVDASWLRLVEESPETWRINEPLDGKKVADAFAKALQPQACASKPAAHTEAMRLALEALTDSDVYDSDVYDAWELKKDAAIAAIEKQIEGPP